MPHHVRRGRAPARPARCSWPRPARWPRCSRCGRTSRALRRRGAATTSRSPPPGWSRSACAAWLTLTTVVCLAAMTGGRLAFAARVARFAPPITRGFLQAALVSTWAVVPSAAYATAPAPIVLHVGSGGRLAAVPGPASARPTTTPRRPRPAHDQHSTSHPPTAVPIDPTRRRPVSAPRPSCPPVASPHRRDAAPTVRRSPDALLRRARGRQPLAYRSSARCRAPLAANDPTITRSPSIGSG